MLFYLSKIVYIIAMPIAWIIGLLILSLLSKNKNIKKKSLIVSLTMLIVFTNPFLSNLAFRSFEHPLNDINKLEKRELGIILSGVTQNIENDDQRVFFKSGADRVVHAVYMYNRKIINHILVTGGSGAIHGKKETPESERIKLALLELGVKEKDITIESRSRNTHENAVYSKEIIDKKFPNQKPILITSAFHMKRAYACFQKQGLEVTPVSCNIMTSLNNYGLENFLPKEDALAKWGLLTHELIGRIAYQLLGYT